VTHNSVIFPEVEVLFEDTAQLGDDVFSTVKLMTCHSFLVPCSNRNFYSQHREMQRAMTSYLGSNRFKFHPSSAIMSCKFQCYST
jgi:hypothetical protein